jgi:hypothetical protein
MKLLDDLLIDTLDHIAGDQITWTRGFIGGFMFTTTYSFIGMLLMSIITLIVSGKLIAGLLVGAIIGSVYGLYRALR